MWPSNLIHKWIASAGVGVVIVVLWSYYNDAWLYYGNYTILKQLNIVNANQNKDIPFSTVSYTILKQEVTQTEV